FVALRDGETHAHPSIAHRRARYEDLFEALEAAGVPRASLQLAWDFTTASEASHTEPLRDLIAREREALGETGYPSYVVSNVVDYVEDVLNPYIARRITGSFVAPRYLDDGGVTARLRRDAQGLPVQDGDVSVPFIVLIPHSAWGD